MQECVMEYTQCAATQAVPLGSTSKQGSIGDAELGGIEIPTVISTTDDHENLLAEKK